MPAFDNEPPDGAFARLSHATFVQAADQGWQFEPAIRVILLAYHEQRSPERVNALRQRLAVSESSNG